MNANLKLRLRVLGLQDACNGKPIYAFYAIPKIRHTEAMRAEYEIGYRAGKADIEAERKQHETQN